MQVKRGLLTRRIILSAALVFAPLSIVAFSNEDASAAQLTNRSLTLQAGATDGGSLAGGTVRHLFRFDVPSTTSLGSISFRYCTTAGVGSVGCTTPTGLTTTSATLGSEAGSDLTGFSINATTNGAPYLFRTAASPTSGDTAVLRIDGVVNPDAVNESFFVRISTYTSTDTTGSVIDEGTVTASTATPIELTGTMPESLIFCTGESITTTLGIPDCSTATAGDITFDQLFSPTDTASTQSQMAASTNAGFGYVITVNGETLESGSTPIDPMTTTTTGTRGIGQFGLNLVANTTATTTVARGVNVAPAPDADDLRGEPTTDYGTVDNFKFVSGNTVASSTNGGLGPTNAQIFTVSYIVNVPGNQPAGSYTTTLTYICTPTF